jgi:hypothetical protein
MEKQRCQYAQPKSSYTSHDDGINDPVLKFFSQLPKSILRKLHKKYELDFQGPLFNRFSCNNAGFFLVQFGSNQVPTFIKIWKLIVDMEISQMFGYNSGQYVDMGYGE